MQGIAPAGAFLQRTIRAMCLPCQVMQHPESYLTLTMQAFERRLWPHEHPLRQFDRGLPYEVMNKVSPGWA